MFYSFRDHIHFIDGAEGGYTMVAQNFQEQMDQRIYLPLKVS
ncbi:MAG: DUF3095 family protein [Oligoflexus sp.]